MSIRTVGELIDALARYPDDMPVGTVTRDYVGAKFEPSVMVDNAFVNENGRSCDDGCEVLVIC